MKKIISSLLVLMMILAMAAPALAEETAATTGSITISNAVVGQEYTIYKIFDADEGKENVYKVDSNSPWKTFLTNTAKDYVTVDDGGYVFWNQSKKSDADARAFAQSALAYAKTNRIDNQGEKTAENSEDVTTTIVFENLDFGYYLVDSTLGVLCGLNTVNPYATIEEKNGVPTNEKTVEEDSTGNYGKTNDADLTQTINFQSTIIAQPGAQNYVFHDKMSAGLTYKEVTGITLNDVTVDSKNYTVKASELDDNDCTFEVVFTNVFCDTLKANDKIVISYTAKLNENAVVGGDGNDNESWLKYGDGASTTHDKTKTYTWDMAVLKYADGVESNPLKDAEFVLLNNDRTMVATVIDGKLTGWESIPAANQDGTITWPDNAVLTTGTNGMIKISGLDADKYYLREIKAPTGYNKLGSDVEIKIESEPVENDTTKLTYKKPLATVNNESGTVLPSTGGVGTTIFYVVGGLMVLVAVVLLVTKKKMSSDSGKD